MFQTIERPARGGENGLGGGFILEPVIFTSQAQSWDLCMAELQAVLPDSRIKWLVPGVGLLTTGASFPETAAMLRDAKPIFLRHIFPAAHIFETDSYRYDTPIWLDAIHGVLAVTDQREFSVQVRILDESVSFSKYDLTQHISETLRKGGKTLHVKNPLQAVSVVIFKNTVYMGLSDTADNLSAWPGGMRRYERQEERISRAEFKLLEAIEVFGLDLPGCRTALDLGAAPGGWSKILAEHGMEVTAVDPAHMDPLPRVTHHRELAQDFINRCTLSFDILVNDMRMDVRESVAITLGAADRLAPGGLLVMTFKLPLKKKKAMIHHGLEALSHRFDIEHVKQLFHNRSEITVTGRLSGSR